MHKSAHVPSTVPYVQLYPTRHCLFELFLGLELLRVVHRGKAHTISITWNTHVDTCIQHMLVYAPALDSLGGNLVVTLAARPCLAGVTESSASSDPVEDR